MLPEPQQHSLVSRRFPW